MENTPRLDDLIAVIKTRHPEGDALRQLTDAVVLGEHLGELADHLIGHFVDQARHSGASWTEIGHSMGVTKQAAQKRFVAKERDGTMEDHLKTFARFDDAARRAVVGSQEAARQARHDRIGPEHLLLALLNESQSPAARIVETLSGASDAVRESLAGTFGPAGESALQGHIAFAAQSVKALELAGRESLRLGHEHVGAEHLLLGVLSISESPAVAVLEQAGVTKERAEAEIARLQP
ncbi:Clp protease N-terminal domain-containing protein [Planotetraspora kaengkrachanensis]|uniref:Clp R domain-containing protein n=1 Tax=Planotetraspora kaengkrachanensis TaxID=575193 RepID=A0A8J3PXT1_9ACTN|nr:Clp protease N-terminal domain-containing protein [Planotetraspora kaengkrachanensis]GIG83079.1 hypothetical protein Pka01_62060 [Planotetraspora kaengkrachanensis]